MFGHIIKQRFESELRESFFFAATSGALSPSLAPRTTTLHHVFVHVMHILQPPVAIYCSFSSPHSLFSHPPSLPPISP